MRLGTGIRSQKQWENLEEMKTRLRQAWRKVPSPASIKELAHSIPRDLKNVLKNKGGHAGY